MSKTYSALAVISALALGGCATSPYGGMGGPLEAVLGSVLGGSQSSGSGFQQAAVNACGNYAAQYGQVSVRDVRQ
ncbi:MAG TPA: hypothetical protein VFO69_02015, partial [Allosphingosinicella sp.]|nr:hypothetical protein [Allosphingosinicella sp.]